MLSSEVAAPTFSPGFVNPTLSRRSPEPSCKFLVPQHARRERPAKMDDRRLVRRRAPERPKPTSVHRRLAVERDDSVHSCRLPTRRSSSDGARNPSGPAEPRAGSRSPRLVGRVDDTLPIAVACSGGPSSVRSPLAFASTYSFRPSSTTHTVRARLRPQASSIYSRSRFILRLLLDPPLDRLQHRVRRNRFRHADCT